MTEAKNADFEPWITDADIPDDGRKFFIPLENNPVVFTPLAAKLTGLDNGYSFHDVLSLDPELLAFIPRPAIALIAIIPSKVHSRRRALETRPDLYTGSGEDEPVHWFKQTIGHACGLMSLIHALSNTYLRQQANQDSLLTTLLHDAIVAEPKDRAQVLYDSAALEEAHASVAGMGDTAAPSPSDPNYHHFITFVKGKDGHLYELEGCAPGPLDRGKLDEDEDMLSEHALKNSVRPFIDVADANVDFSLVALSLE